jgi:hypothetical protein
LTRSSKIVEFVNSEACHAAAFSTDILAESRTCLGNYFQLKGEPFQTLPHQFHARGVKNLLFNPSGAHPCTSRATSAGMGRGFSKAAEGIVLQELVLLKVDNLYLAHRMPGHRPWFAID